ncbi:MAG: S24/S26 family peptidase [Ruminococcus sp.]|nr:S24/S26 family peptidase [Ruminococcus sp.]
MIEDISIEQAVQKGNFVIHPHGVSMWPMIRNGIDTVLIEPVQGRCEKYDIPLYKDRLGRYVVHRIIEVTDTGYVILGDGLFEKEYDITDENILGVVRGFFRKEKYIPCTSRGYMLYVKIWVGLVFMRKPIIVIVRKYRRLKNLLRDYYLRLTKGKNHYLKEKDRKETETDN